MGVFVMNARSDLKQGASLIGDILSHLSNLVRKEVDLARSEISENLGRAGVAIGLLVAAVVIALTALNVLSAALVAGLTEFGITAGWSAVIVGGVLAVIAFGMVKKGLSDLKLSSLAPTRTAENVRRDAETIKEALHD